LPEGNQDRQTAEDKKESSLAGLVSSRPVLFEPYKKSRTDKSQICQKVGTQSHGSKAVQTAMTARLPKTSYQDSKR
jgi:hypothetical protein